MSAELEDRGPKENTTAIRNVIIAKEMKDPNDDKKTEADDKRGDKDDNGDNDGQQHHQEVPEDEESDEDEPEEDEFDEEAEYEAEMEKREGDRKDRDALLKRINKQLIEFAAKDVFAVGRRSGIEAVKPVAIRWSKEDAPHVDHGKSCLLPLGDDVEHKVAFEQLLEDCQPATFGLGQEEVLDEEYRKAGKMDSGRFCTSLNLSEYGIMEVVGKALARIGQGVRSVRAELYKLNVGPSSC